MNAWAFTVRLMEHSLGELAERVERMADADFLADHAAVHEQPRSPAIDLVAAVLERELWRRWPEGRDD